MPCRAVGLASAAGSSVVTLAIGVLLMAGGASLGAWTLAAGPTADEPPQVLGETPVTAMDLRGRVAVTSPVVARDPTAPEFLAAATRRDAPGPDCGLEVSGDGGMTWVPVDAFAALPDGIKGCYNPQVAFGADGRLVVTFLGMAGPPPRPVGLYAVASDDRAQTFTQAYNLADIAAVTPETAVSARGIEVVWVEPAEDADWSDGAPWPVGWRVEAAVGDAGGVGDPMVVADPEGLVAAPTIAADPEGGDVAVAYYELPAGASTDEGAESLVGAGPWRLMVAHRGSGDQRFGVPVEVARFELIDQAVWAARVANGAEAPTTLPPLLVSPWGIAEPGLAVRTGRTCTTWTDSDDDGRLHPFVACSTDQGSKSWRGPTRVSSDHEGWLPQVALAPSGRAHTVFYARGPQADEDLVEAWFADVNQSGQAGRPVRLSSVGSPPQGSPRAGWYGSRLGLAAGESQTAVAMWADNRNASPRYRSQTIFAAVVNTPAPASASLWQVIGGLVGVGFAMVAGGLLARRRRFVPGRAPPTATAAPAPPQ